MDLAHLVYSDLFLVDQATSCWYKETPDSLTAKPVPVELEPECQALRCELLSLGGFKSSRIEWPRDSGIRLRVERIEVADKQVVFICRRFNLPPGQLTSLGVPPEVARRLLSPTLKEGLVIFFGKAGSGKSTTAASFITERLNLFGGVCWTIENPVELPLQGKHGKGWCYQTEASTDEAIGPAIPPMLRATPNILLVGEIRDAEVAREIVTAGNSGHLVVCTLHAPDLLSGIARLCRLAGDPTAVADALRVGMHLSLHTAVAGDPPPPSMLSIKDTKGTGTPARVLGVQPLFINGDTADGIKSYIREGSIHQLKSEVERQRRGLMQSLP
jgi:twitching motility protein PilT